MSTTVGIFDSQSDAEGVIDRLDGLGLPEGSIHVITRRSIDRGSGSILGALARGLRGGDGALSAELQRLGLGQDEAAFYEEELDEESILLAVQAEGGKEDEVMAVMRESSATVRE